MKTITVEFLKKNNACRIQVALFKRIFGASAKLTEKNWDKAQTSGLNCIWLSKLLQGPALAEYEKIQGPALAEYEKIRGAAIFNALEITEDKGQERGCIPKNNRRHYETR